MEQVNAMRAVLVAGAVIAAALCAFMGLWSAAVVLAAGVVGHALLWRHLHRTAPAPVPVERPDEAPPAA